MDGVGARCWLEVGVMAVNVDQLGPENIIAQQIDRNTEYGVFQSVACFSGNLFIGKDNDQLQCVWDLESVKIYEFLGLKLL